jgi:hypothetical protein
MKILYVGHYKENSGWSNAAINNILALDSIGVDVVCKDIKLTNKPFNIPNRILELEQKPLSGVTHCIQHILPHHMVGSDQFKKSVCYYVGESIHTKKNSWHSYLELVDEVWVPNIDLHKNTQQFVSNAVRILPHTFDINKYRQEFKKINFGSESSFFKFYTIGDINDRKNMIETIKCFYHAFSSDQDVLFIAKIKKHGLTQSNLQKYTEQLCESIQNSMKLYSDKTKYGNVRFITSDCDDDFIYALHNSCDCFLNISHGEAWSIPSFESMCFGNTPICSNEGGPAMYINDDKAHGTLIDGTYTICNQSDAAFDHIFTGSEFWFQPNHISTVNAMKFYYEHRDVKNKEECLTYASKFDYSIIGQQIKDMLND